MCREQLPVWQEFYTRHAEDGIELITVAVDAQGAERARPYVEKAGATFTTLVDERNLLSQMFSFKAVPNGMLIDEEGVLQYRKFGGFDIRKQEYAELMEAWVSSPSSGALAEQGTEDSLGGADHQRAIERFQRGVTLYQEGKVEEAVVEWRLGRDLEPDNWVVRKQIWAVEHPEHFYQGPVNFQWQREQREKGT